MVKGIFAISLDFELHWGGFEKWDADKYKTYFQNTRAVIPKMLELFTAYDVHVTWATVGMLFFDNYNDLKKSIPEVKPTYSDPSLSAYHYMLSQGIGENEKLDPLHYAKSLVQNIISSPGQELGSHTFAHYYCNEQGQTIAQFKADLQAAQAAAEKLGKTLHSLVFPRNQFNDEYLKACYDAGFSAVRSNPVDWFWKIETRSESWWKRLNRGLDAYIPLGSKNSFALSSIQMKDGFPICIPASRLLRPYRPQELFMNNLKVKRVVSEIKSAARLGEVYHLWWHPHNFGYYPEESLRDLETILKQYQKCRENFGMRSLTMNELSSLVRS